jgi:hypothetical protein
VISLSTRIRSTYFPSPPPGFARVSNSRKFGWTPKRPDHVEKPRRCAGTRNAVRWRSNALAACARPRPIDTPMSGRPRWPGARDRHPCESPGVTTSAPTLGRTKSFLLSIDISLYSFKPLPHQQVSPSPGHGNCLTTYLSPRPPPRRSIPPWCMFSPLRSCQNSSISSPCRPTRMATNGLGTGQTLLF